MSNKSGTSEQIISLPKGGGALQGIGEKFAPDLFTGTGNFTVPISLPSGRNGFQPELNLVYSTGNGNGPFGLGWSLSVPGVSRKTSKGVPQYHDGSSDFKERDTFVLSGAEDLVPVAEYQTIPTEHPDQINHITQYRPRTEGLFALINRHREIDQDTGTVKADYWEVKSKDGLKSTYGNVLNIEGEEQNSNEPAVVADPDRRDHIFAWRLTETQDPFGSRIVYEYERDSDAERGHHWDQIYLKHIRYIDYNDPNDDDKDKFLVSVTFEYEDQPGEYEYRLDPFSEYRSGFEIRTRKRCKAIVTRTHHEKDILVRTYRLVYLDERSDLPDLDQLLPSNGVSLLSQILITGHDESQPIEEDRTQALPPLEFGYTRFEPHDAMQRGFDPLRGHLPSQSLLSPFLELADLFGDGLPDLVEIGSVRKSNGYPRYWRNLGNGKFDLPRPMREAPAGLSLADAGVQLIDADGDGRIDLLATINGLNGYFPLQFGGLWDQRSFRRYATPPSFNLEGPEVKLVDLTGDGVTDAIRSGSSLECFINDPEKGWHEVRRVERQALDRFPNVNFSDPRVRWGDMSGDGLQDIVLVHDGSIEYWPNLGHGDWAPRIHMRNSPRFPDGYNPQRILVGDVDGDGLADVLYIEDTKITLWINQSGNCWSDPIEIIGTPGVSDMDAVRLVDLLGTGVSGILWSSDAPFPSRDHYFFLDLTGKVKPYLLVEMNNHMGAVTKVGYASACRFYLEDEKHPETRWKTPLPFPVQVVAQVEVLDEISKGKLTTEYRYHHGYWDGAEREFRGFGRVDHCDTETFARYHAAGLHTQEDFANIPLETFSPPLETRTWFHLGPVGEAYGAWGEPDFSHEFCQEDPQLLQRPAEMEKFMISIGERRVKRDVLRTLRGRILRTELYALDGSQRQDRPYTVTESLHGISTLPVGAALPEEIGDWERWQKEIFFPHNVAQRTTQWERGNDPLTQFSFTADYDAYGQPQTQIQIACPRNWRTMDDKPQSAYLATRTYTEYAQSDVSDVYIHDRIAKTSTYEFLNQGGITALELKDVSPGDSALAIIGQQLNYYDSNSGNPERGAFIGKSLGFVGLYGALVRTETLSLTDKILDAAYAYLVPPYLKRGASLAWSQEYPSPFRDYLEDHPWAGHLHKDSAAGTGCEDNFYAVTLQRKYDFHENQDGKGRGLIKEIQDPMGNLTQIGYEKYALLPCQVTTVNVTGDDLVTQAEYDYRVLQPSMVTGPNGNRSAFTYKPLGLPAASAVMGKEGENTGDEKDRQITPSTMFTYDFSAFQDRRKPIAVHTTRRVHHVSDEQVPEGENDATIETAEYSDGFGRLLQTRAQGEDLRFGDETFGGGNEILTADQNDPSRQEIKGRLNSDRDNPNVVVSGWQVYDNKGREVEKYEPFFSRGWEYAQPLEVQRREKVTLFYDPRGQVVLTLNPDGSKQHVIYGVPGTLSAVDLAHPEHFDPTPWEAYTYDANDNAVRTHGDAARAYEHHWNTPASIEIDALGRTIRSVERNRSRPNGVIWSNAVEEHCTRSSYDIRGNLIGIRDPLGRNAFIYTYDLADNAVRTDSFDAGTRIAVLDAAGNVLETRDLGDTRYTYTQPVREHKGSMVLRRYDAFNRLTHLWARNRQAESLTLRERLIYGDNGQESNGLTETEVKHRNLLGKLYCHYDEAGLQKFSRHDFKGNLQEKIRHVISDVALASAGDVWVADWDGANAESHLEGVTYQTNTEFDALNRPKSITLPQEADSVHRSSITPTYNRAGALKKVKLNEETSVDHIAYNAKGQRTLIGYGKGIMTRYAYDPLTFRLARMLTEENLTADLEQTLTYQPGGKVLQDFGYTYDLVGNILAIVDRTPNSGVKGNTDTSLVPDTVPFELVLHGQALIRRFEYDPLNRLVSATGRECENIKGLRLWNEDLRSRDYTPRPATPTPDNAHELTKTYTEKYDYDPAGNILQLIHSSSGQTWKRYFGMAGYNPNKWDEKWKAQLGSESWPAPQPGNWLSHVGNNSDTSGQSHFYDDSGNMIRQHTERHYKWDHADRLITFRNQPQGSGYTSATAHYLYGADGMRVKKWVRKNNGPASDESTVYIDGVFEHHRWINNGEIKENNHLHVMDGQQRIALLRVGERYPGDEGPEVQYHLGDHLGSSNVVVDEDCGWISREEYFPYGETSLGSFAKKRYRLTGKEKDEESGFYNNGARYYAPGLGKWINCDKKINYNQNFNLYIFCHNNALKYIDPSGKEPIRSLLGGNQGRMISLTNRGVLTHKPLFTDMEKGSENYKLYEVDTIEELEKVAESESSKVEILVLGYHSGEGEGGDFLGIVLSNVPENYNASEKWILNEQNKRTLLIDDLSGKSKKLSNLFNKEEAHIIWLGCGPKFNRENERKKLSSELAKFAGAKKGSVIFAVGFVELVPPESRDRSTGEKIKDTIRVWFWGNKRWRLRTSAVAKGERIHATGVGFYQYSWSDSKFNAGELKYIGRNLEIDQLVES